MKLPTLLFGVSILAYCTMKNPPRGMQLEAELVSHNTNQALASRPR